MTSLNTEVMAWMSLSNRTLGSKLLLIGLVSNLFFPVFLSASTLERGGASARAMGTRGADAAACDGSRSVVDNPAALADLRQPSALLGLDARIYALTLSQERAADTYPAVQPQRVAAVTAALALPLTEKLALGLLAHLPITGPTRLQAYDFRRPQLPIWQSLGEGLNLAVAIGWRPAATVALGFGVQVSADLDARADFSLDLAAGEVTQRRVDIRLRSHLVPYASLRWNSSAKSVWMLRWRAAYQVDFDVPLQVALNGALKTEFRLSGQGLFSPEVWSLAWAYQRDAWSMYARVRYERWSELRSFAPSVTTSIGAQSPFVSVGSSDVWVPQVGGQRQLASNWRLRAGLGFRPTPLPKADGAASWLDSHAFEGSFGFSWRVFATSWIDVACGWSHFWTRTTARRVADHPVGDVAIRGGIGHAALAFRHHMGTP